MQAALDAGNEDFLNAVADNDAVADGEALVEAIRAGAEEWKSKVADLGYDTSVDYDELAAYLAANEVDLAPFMEEFREVAKASRPS